MCVGIEAAAQPFRDCTDCPEMVLVPSGRFVMGSSEREGERMNEEGGRRGSLSFLLERERPQRTVEIATFAAGRYEVTVAEYAAFARATGFPAGQNCISDQDGDLRWEWSGAGNWRQPGFSQTDRDPVVCVSWEDVQHYIAWLNTRTQGGYRLLTEAEWEYVARAGSQMPYTWGESASDACRYANVGDETALARYHSWRTNGDFLFSCNDEVLFTSPVGRYVPNAMGLFDVIGNVSEWVQDCYEEHLRHVPSNGLAYVGGRCRERTVRGGSWNYTTPQMLRAAFRTGSRQTNRQDSVGFRVARDMVP